MPWYDHILDRVVAASAVLVAYLVTAVTVIPAIEDKAAIQRMRQTAHFRRMVGFLTGAVWTTLAFLVYALLVPVFAGAMNRFEPTTDRLLSALFWGVGACALCMVVRAVRLLMKAVLAR